MDKPVDNYCKSQKNFFFEGHIGTYFAALRDSGDSVIASRVDNKRWNKLSDTSVRWSTA